MIGNEGVGATYIEGGYSREFFGVVYAVFFEYFGCNGYRGVYWVADDGFFGY